MSEQWHAMTQLLPQIRYWIKTGFVAANKIISVHIPKLYSIVRGKAGKKVEFGLQWGISRLRGGFLLARVASDRRELVEPWCDEEHLGEGESAGRSWYRDGETFEVWLHKTGGPLGTGNGDVRPARGTRLQPEQGCARVGEAEKDGPRWLSTAFSAA